MTEWYIEINGIRFEGEIKVEDNSPVNSSVPIWTLRTYNKEHRAQIDICAPCTRCGRGRKILYKIVCGYLAAY